MLNNAIMRTPLWVFSLAVFSLTLPACAQQPVTAAPATASAVKNSTAYGDCALIDFKDIDSSALTKAELVQKMDQDFADNLNNSEKCMAEAINSGAGRISAAGAGAGNTGDAAFVDVLSQELSAESTATRRRAADAISRLPAEQARPALLDALVLESDPQVSTALIDALKHAGATSPELVDVLEKRINSSDANQRAATIDLLGSQQTERAQQLLIAQYKRETDAQLKMQIGRYVPARALR